MDIGLALLLLILATCASAVIAWFLAIRTSNKSIQGYNSIAEATSQAQQALTSAQNSYRNLHAEYTKRQQEYASISERTKKLVELESRANEIQQNLQNGHSRIELLKAQMVQQEQNAEQMKNEILQIRSELDLYTLLMDYVDFGMFEEPEYLHETPDRYKVEIDQVRKKQKDLIGRKSAVEVPDNIEVEGSSQKGTSIIDGQARLMLRAFNIECDLLIEKVNPSNFPRTLERIEKVADALEKSAISLMCGISTEYVELKFQECRLYYEYKLKKAAEQEEQRMIREQMREEQKAIQEFQRAIDEAEREERMYEKLIEKAKLELQLAGDTEREKLRIQIAYLEDQLREAHVKEERAKSLAEQTRRGHIYVISNIGSFGDDVYKVGMTRRLDPMDRVRELGDASVPFPFDVHAIIFSDDAPTLEAKLHRRFRSRRVNAVNYRKEFFNINIEEIQKAVAELAEKDVEFKLTAIAEEYYETRRLLGSLTELSA